MPRSFPSSSLAVALALLATHPGPALEAQEAAASHDAPVARAARASGPIRLDGRLSEPSWEAATPITDFIQNDPEEGRPVSQPTEVRILWDEDALYVGAILRDSVGVASRLARRDSWLEDSDWFLVALDSYHDHLTAFRFMVNPSGVRRDAILTGDDGGGDDSWDPVWEAETRVSPAGWTAELRIPFSQLRFAQEPERVWGIQLERTIARRQEEAVFAFTPKSERGGIARYGHLEGPGDIRRGAGLEFLPYLVARAEYVQPEPVDGAPFPDPYRDGSEYFAEVGADLKYRVASNLTLDATVNPDFGQVELDPAVVNLTAFETRFDERRPFFVEGGDIFEFGESGGFGGATQLLYSRRIGGEVDWEGPDDIVYDDAPDGATILGAAKLTGRTAGGWTIGLLEAVTGEESARFVDAAGERGAAAVAPLSSYFAGRVQRRLRQGRTVLGAIATAVHRRLGDFVLRDRLRSEAYAGGVDFTHEWADRTWALTGWLAGSRIAGSPAAIEIAQRSSARYFQRPDADHLSLDPAATSLSGYAASVELSKEAGLHWRGDLEATVTSPGFEVNDIGFQRDADRVDVGGSVRYVENRPGSVLRDWSLELRPDAAWSHGGDFLGIGLSLEAEGELLSYWSGEVEFSRDFPGFDDRLTRGGPLTREVASNRLSVELESDSRKWWVVEADGGYEWDAAGGEELELGLDLSLRPAESWNLSLGPELTSERALAQYLGEVEDPTASATYGRRYVFAALDQTVLALETRLNVTFRPGLSLEAYARPFLASAAFDGVKELRAPRSFSFLRYGRDVGTVTREGTDLLVDPDGDGPAQPFVVEDEDFNRRSLRSSAVLRWEWRPGSTLFLVWQQFRSDVAEADELRLRRDVGALFRAPADDVLVLKVSYWLSP